MDDNLRTLNEASGGQEPGFSIRAVIVASLLLRALLNVANCISQGLGAEDVLSWGRDLVRGSRLQVHMLTYGNFDQRQSSSEGKI